MGTTDDNEAAREVSFQESIYDDDAYVHDRLACGTLFAPCSQA